MTSRVRLAVLPLLLLVLAGCGGGTVNAMSSTAGDASGGAVAPGLSEAGGQTAKDAVASSPEQRSIVSTGTVSLESKDVAEARSRVDDLLARYGGVVADENTTTDRKGRAEHVSLTVRVPSADFGTVMARLAKVATLRDSSRAAEDVTTQVIDTDARISAQEAGVKRLEELVGTAADLKDLLAVENELTQRRADLESLKQQRAWLADQTSLATISVEIARTGTEPPVKATGFWGGLKNGWHAMTAFLTGTATAAGAAVPFAVLLVLIGTPVWLVVRRLRRRRLAHATG